MESFKASQFGEWSVFGLPAFADNYLWVLVHGASRSAIAVDPGCADTVQGFLNQHGVHLSGILVTHHHPDHVGGVQSLLESVTATVPVWASHASRVPQVTHRLAEGDRLEWPDLRLKVLEVPGHTLDHVAYVAEATGSNRHWLFCGDTLFSGGCGRVFEGTAEQMHESLQKLAALPAETLVFCAHEYTESNLKFALAMAPEDADIRIRMNEVQEIRGRKASTIPVELGTEMRSNLFLKSKNSIEFKNLRTSKDHFKG